MGVFGLICYMQTMTLSCRLINCIQFMLFRNKKNKILLKTSYVIYKAPKGTGVHVYQIFTRVKINCIIFIYTVYEGLYKHHSKHF